MPQKIDEWSFNHIVNLGKRVAELEKHIMKNDEEYDKHLKEWFAECLLVIAKFLLRIENKL